MKVLVINGANLNMLGIREPALYGNRNYAALKKYIRSSSKLAGVRADIFQSNHEGAIVSRIQKAFCRYDGIIINAGAYTHTSVAILDALKAVGIPTVEVHLTDIAEREDFRKFSYISLYAEKVIKGKGFEGYALAIRYLADKNSNKSVC